jgi:hypothetical protein
LSDPPTIDPTKVRYAVIVDYLRPDNTQSQLKQSFATLEDAESALYAQIATGVFRFTPNDYGDYPGAPYRALYARFIGSLTALCGWRYQNDPPHTLGKRRGLGIAQATLSRPPSLRRA